MKTEIEKIMDKEVKRYDYSAYHLRKKRKHKSKQERIENKSVQLLKNSIEKMQKGFIMGVDIHSIRMTETVKDFIADNNLIIVGELLRLK